MLDTKSLCWVLGRDWFPGILMAQGARLAAGGAVLRHGDLTSQSPWNPVHHNSYTTSSTVACSDTVLQKGLALGEEN
jgi:hypothetical protein